VAQRDARLHLEQGRRQLLLAIRLDHLGEQGLLVAVVVVDGELGDTGGGRDLVHAGPVEPLGREQPAGGVQDHATLLQVLRAAGGGGGFGGRRGGFVVHSTILDYPVCYL